MSASPYRLLVGHPRTDGTWKSGRALRMQYLQLTDRLIEKATTGVELRDGSGTVRPDAVIFLDKSARPISWLLRDMWSRFSPLEVGGAPSPRPALLFLNIDRLQWVTTVDPHGQGFMDVDRVDPSIVRSLRSVFVEPRDKRDGLTDAIDSAPAALDGKTLLVVDEVYSSGRTADIAARLIQRGFPTARIATAHWMGGLVARGGATGNADIPVWYDESSEYGRGIGNRQVGGGTHRISDNVTQRLGAWFLSTRLPQLDERGALLRRELRMLAHEPDVPLRPSLDREDVIERIEWLNRRPFAAVQEEIRAILAETSG